MNVRTYAWINSLQYNVWSALEESEIRTYILLFAFHQGVIVAWNCLWPCVSSTYVWKNFLKYYWTCFKTSIKKKIREDLVFVLNVGYAISYELSVPSKTSNSPSYGVEDVDKEFNLESWLYMYEKDIENANPNTSSNTVLKRQRRSIFEKTILKENLWFDWIYEV